ncbi:MAG: PspC domain-containing protein [Cytophagales bacterium]|nr:PspC domain-containing protein [Hyphobacterium sp. CCMP332]
MKSIVSFFENRAFGVCASISEKLGMSSTSVRLFFIYASFLTFGSPVLIYLILAFLKDFKAYIRKSSSTIWDF